MIRNFGIFAHVDAGKTTLTERMLLETGMIREAGSVDRGTAHTDSLPVEQRRGISVKSSCVQMHWKDCRMHLIDTPGHADFSAQIERALWAMDGAVLVLSGVEGVQPQTELLYEELQGQQMPMILFLNKMDRDSASEDQTMEDVHRNLTERAARHGNTQEMLEAMCAADDGWMERFLSDEAVVEEEIRAGFAKMATEGRVYPVFSGSALRGTGVCALLDGILEYFPQPGGESLPLCGVVFALTQDRLLGNGAMVRLFGGRLSNRQDIEVPGNGREGENGSVLRKVTQVRDMEGHDVGMLSAGEIGVVYGLGAVSVSQVIGAQQALPRRVQPGHLRTPLMTVQVIPEDGEDMERVRAACSELSREDPLLEARYIRSLKEEHLQVMGHIHREVLEEELRQRFGLKIHFGPASLIYRETIGREAVGFCAYTMPKPCWAVLRMILRPGARGSGVQFRSTVPVRTIQERYQHQVAQAIPMALAQGRRGWQVTDIEIELVDGSDHQFHTHPLDFIVATPMAVHDGLQRGGSVLLEPVMELRLRVPGTEIGRVTSDVLRMRGTIQDTHMGKEYGTITAFVPASTSLDYATELAAATGGRGSLSMRLHHYAPCPEDVDARCPRETVDPLDQSRYILAARHALDSGIFD